MKPVWTTDQVVAQLTNWGGKWNTSGPVPFMFYEMSLPHHEFSMAFASFNAAERQSLVRTMELVSDVANISFVNIAAAEIGPSAGNRFMGFYAIKQESAPFWGAATGYVTEGEPPQPMGQIYGVDVVVNHWRADVQGNWEIGDSNSRKLMHELLHGLGLDHAGNYNGDSTPGYEESAVYFQDSNQFTVMSYFGAAATGASHSAGGVLQFASTPLLYDVAALQALYGANLSTRTGDTVYGFNTNSGRAAFDLDADPSAVFTIWDAGGVDSLDLSGYASASRVDLREGAFSDAGGMTSNISIAYGARIENAIGGAGNDSLTGNDLANRLSGGAGSDTLDGGAGADMLDGGGGADAMTGGAGDDIYFVDEAGDQVIELAGGGIDSVRAGISFSLAGLHAEDVVLLGSAAIDATGNAGANSLTGNAAANRLDGGAGADTMIGGGGNDVYVVDHAGDRAIELGGGGSDLVQSIVTFSLAGQDLEALTLLGTAAIDGSGNGLANSLTGNAAANRLDGGAGADVLTGGAGNDVYLVDDALDRIVELAGGGIDIVESSVSHALGSELEALTLTGLGAIDGSGNALDNVITGNEAANLLDGGLGADLVAGGGGNDAYVVDNALDEVRELAGGGIDTVRSAISYALGAELETLVLSGGAAINGVGNALANSLSGNDANNVLDGGAGADTMIGGAGDDIFHVDDLADIVSEAASQGRDLVISTVTFALSGAAADVEDLTLAGIAAIGGTGNALANALTGNSGNNVLNGGAGADTMIGGAGDDVFTVDNVGDVVVENGSQGRDLVISALSFTLNGNAVHVEDLTLTGAAPINGTGNAFANVLTGNSGNNVLNGGAGADVMRGGAGDDTFYVENAGDVVAESGSQGRDLVISTLSFSLNGSAIHVEDLTLAGSFSLNATGNAFANTLTGNSGNNVLNGGAGADVMRGGAGNDIYHVENAGDVVVENGSQGRDLVISTLSFSLNGSAIHVEDLTLAGSAAINATGNAFANVLTGNTAANVLNGGAGADTMTGGAGNDSYVVDNAGDRVIESAGGGVDSVQSAVSLVLAANVENLTLTGSGATSGTGNGGDNVLKGNSAANALAGGDGADRLHGGLGSDSLTGGAGVDGFYFDTAPTSANIDRILDFSSVSDTIWLDRSIFRGIAVSGTLAPSAFQIGTAANDGLDRIVYDQASGRVFYDADGNGAGAAVLFAQVNAGLALTASDFSAYLPS